MRYESVQNRQRLELNPRLDEDLTPLRVAQWDPRRGCPRPLTSILAEARGCTRALQAARPRPGWHLDRRELGLVYAGLGSHAPVVEFTPRLLLGADADLVKIMVKQAEERFGEIMVESKVVGIEKTAAGFEVDVEYAGATKTHE